MNNFCNDILSHVGLFLCVKDCLLFEVAVGRRIFSREELFRLYHMEPKIVEVNLRKKGRIVKYVLSSYYANDILYTKVKSWYGSHKIISVVTHKFIQSTRLANEWTLKCFTDPSRTRYNYPLLLKLHA